MKSQNFSQKYRIKIVILTLKDYPKRLDRLSDIIDIFEKSGLTVDFFYGVNGKNIQFFYTDNENIKKIQYESTIYYYDKTVRGHGKGMTNGEIGASWSHLEIYKSLLLDNNYDNYLIFEDDFELLVNIPKFLQYLKNLPHEYDVCHICLSDWYPIVRLDKINNYFHNIPKDRYFNRATAYILSKTGAKKLLDYSNGFVNVTPDDLLCGIHIYSKLNCKFYASDQYLFKELENTISNVVSIDSS